MTDFLLWCALVVSSMATPIVLLIHADRMAEFLRNERRLRKINRKHRRK